MARPRSDIRPRILHAARRRFLHDGVDGASQRQIAREARTNLGMVYYYFPTKDDLFLAVVDDVYDRILSDLEAALAVDVPADQRIARLYVRLGRLDADEIDVVRIIVRESLVSSDRRRLLLDRFARGHLPAMLSTFADGVGSEVFRDLEAPIMLLFATGALGLVPQLIRHLVGPSFHGMFTLPNGEQLARIAADVLVHGIGGPNVTVARSSDRARPARTASTQTKLAELKGADGD